MMPEVKSYIFPLNPVRPDEGGKNDQRTGGTPGAVIFTAAVGR